MKRSSFAVLILVFFGLSLRPASATAQDLGWQAIGPPGGDIADIVGDSSRLYALIGPWSGQLFTSADAGQSWTRRAAGLGQNYGLAVDPSDPALIYVLGVYGVNRSTDGGATWARTDFLDYFYGVEGQIVVHPLDPNLIMAAGHHDYWSSQDSYIAFMKSTDAGVTWSRIRVGPASVEGRGLSLAADPSDLSTVYLAGYDVDGSGTTTGRIYKSTDGGATWTDAIGPISSDRVESIVLDPGNPARIFASTTRHVYRSSDGGQTWSRNEGQAYGHDLVIDPLDANVLYAGADNSVFRSADGGITWTYRPAARAGACRGLLVSGVSVILGSDRGVFKSDDAGLTWRSSQAGLNAQVVRSVAVAPLWPYPVFAAIGSHVYKSTDFGETWVEPPFAFDAGTPVQIAVDPSATERLFAVVKGCGSG